MATEYPQADLPRSVTRGGADVWDVPQAGVLLWEDFVEPASADVRPPDLEWDWSEAVQPEFQVNGYQQTDLVAEPARQIDLDWNWDEHASDEWAADQSVQPAVLAAARPTDLDWSWDEALPPELVALGYQNSDYAQPTPVYFDGWQWDDHADDEWHVDQLAQALVLNTGRANDTDWNWDEALQPEFVALGYQNSDYTQPTPVYFDDWQWDDHAEDEWPVDQTTQLLAVNTARAIDTDWDWNEVVYPEVVSTGYQQVDNTPAPSASQPPDIEWDFSADLAGEDGWTNHYTAYDPANSERAIDTDWDWNEFVTPEFVVLGYQNADVAVVADSAQQPQTDWNFDADFGGEDGWTNHTTAYDATRPYELDWDWSQCGADDWWIYENQKPVQAAVSGQASGSEWDWEESVDDELAPEEFRNTNAVALPSQPPEDQWLDDDCDDSWWIEERIGNDVTPQPTTDISGALVGRNFSNTTRPVSTNTVRQVSSNTSRPVSSNNSRPVSSNTSRPRRN